MDTNLSLISEPPASMVSGIAATYKSRELEGVADLFFYRKVGFRLAQFFARLRLTPTAVTLIGGVFGVIAGHLYFYRALFINLIGFGFHVVANIFDNADGQLARLTNQHSRLGRILDPVVDHTIWLGIYVHLVLRLRQQGFSGTVWILAIAAGVSHGAQAVAADYWRHAYLYFGKGRGELDNSSRIRAEFNGARGWLKLLVGLHLNVTREQELLLPGIKRLNERADQLCPNGVPGPFRLLYVTLVRPTFKWWGLLMTNSRMLLLLILFVIGQPVWFFWAELTIANLLLLFLILQQQRTSGVVAELLTAQSECA